MTPPRHSERGSVLFEPKTYHFILVAVVGFVLVALAKLPLPAVLDSSSSNNQETIETKLHSEDVFALDGVRPNGLESNRWMKFEVRINDQISQAPGRYSVVAFSPETFENFAYGADEVYPAASVIKIVVFAAALEAWEEDRLDFLEEYRLESSDWVEGSGVLRFSQQGRVCTMGELLRLMIIESDNIAANIVINRIGLETIQEFMNRAGFADCRMEHRILDRNASARGLRNEITARETAAFLAAMDRGWILGPQAGAIFWSVMEQQRHDDRFPVLLPDDFPVASKTGTLSGVVHDVGRLGSGPNRVILVCLSKDVPDQWGAGRRIAQIARDWYDIFIEKELSQGGARFE